MRLPFDQPNLDRVDRMQLVLSLCLQLVMLAEAAYALWQGSWQSGTTALGILALMQVPRILRRRLHLGIPLDLEVAAVVFLFAALFLGEMRSYYTRLWWWDLALHAGAGILTGLFGFLLIYVLNTHDGTRLALSPVFVGLFSFAFSLSVGVLWEIFEYGMDQLFGMNMQKTGLDDTMGDLIVNTLGATLVSVGGYFYVKGGDSLVFDRLLRRLVDRRGERGEKHGERGA